MMSPIGRPFQPPPSLAIPLRRSLLGVVVGLGLLAGCSSVSSGDPPLPDSTFTRVLTELHLAKSRYTVDAPYPRSLRDSIFARYDVQSTEFDATLTYYSRHPKSFGALYQSVIDTLQSLQSVNRPTGLPDTVRTDRRRTKPSP